MTLRAVIFDVDGVLLDSREANIAFYRSFLVRRGFQPPSDAVLAQGHYLNMREALTLFTDAAPEQVEEMVADREALQDYPVELARLPEACAETLSHLSGAYRLGLVTSRHRMALDHFFEMSGLRDLFDVVIGFEDYPRPKPAPDPLLAAFGAFGVGATETVYVGDAEVDRACAEAAGSHFIAFGESLSGAPRWAGCFADLPSLVAVIA